MTTPRVSIIVPTYNRADLLGRAIESVMRQTCGDWELIIVDDGSTDGTADAVERYRRAAGDRLVYAARERRGGSSAARNAGIERARGEFVAFLDSDDEFRPEKLSRQLELFEIEPSLGLVYSDYAFVDLQGRHHASAFAECHPLARQVPSRCVQPNLYVCGGRLGDCLLQGYFISTIVGMVRRSVLDDGVRFLEGQRYSEEWLFYLDVVQRCRGGYVDESLSLHHHVADSVSRTSAARNLADQRRLYALIARRFGGCSREARRALGDHRSDCAAQLGWASRRQDRPWAALGYFAEAFWLRPGVSAVRPMFGSLWQALSHPAGRWEVLQP